jgi:hypothetical protein
MSTRTYIGVLITLISPIALSNACAPIAGPGQVAVHTVAPPWKNAAALQYEGAYCTRNANGYVRIYVICMENRGYRVELFGPGGVPMSIAELPLPPRPAAPPPQYQPPSTPSTASPSVPSTSSSSSQLPTSSARAPLGLVTPEQEHVLNTLEAAAGHAIVSCGGEVIMKHLLKQESHGIRCFVTTTLANSYKTITIKEVKDAICSNPDILQRIPLITP